MPRTAKTEFGNRIVSLDRYEVSFLRKHKFHQGEVMRMHEVHRNTWRRLSHFVMRGFLTVQKEYGIPTARITDKGMIVSQGKKPGPAPKDGKKHGTKPISRYVHQFECSPAAHWSVKLIAKLIAEKKLSLRQVSLKSGVAAATIENWFIGRMPAVNRLEYVLGVFDLNLGTAWQLWGASYAQAA